MSWGQNSTEVGFKVNIESMLTFVWVTFIKMKWVKWKQTLIGVSIKIWEAVETFVKKLVDLTIS